MTFRALVGDGASGGMTDNDRNDREATVDAKTAQAIVAGIQNAIIAKFWPAMSLSSRRR